jgi:hypothetical protein
MLITYWLFVNTSCIVNIETIYCIKHVQSSKVTDCVDKVILWIQLKIHSFCALNVDVCVFVHACAHVCTCYICADSNLLRCNMSVFVINVHSFLFTLILSCSI